MSQIPYPEINADRLWQRHEDMAKIGATPGGGVHRLALTKEDIEAHCLLAEWAEARGFSIAIDDIGNMFIRREGKESSLPPVTSGSHTDTQPFGGRFDGITGVLTAFEAMETIDEAGIETIAPLETAIWNNEEGARYFPACLGSAVYAGNEPLHVMLAKEDNDGITLASCVEDLKKALPQATHRPLESPLGAFLEVHIEQGTLLEEGGSILGVVTGMQGYRRFSIDVTGEETHSGTTPRKRRKDALFAAVNMVQALREEMEMDDEADTVRFTIGQFSVHPGAMSVVPGHVNFRIDLRHGSMQTLARLGDAIPVICKDNAGPCDVSVQETVMREPMEFPNSIRDHIASAADRRGYANQPILSGAGHDSRHAAKLCPAGMIFIPCWKGLSHNEAERAEPEHIAAACQVISDLLIDIANE